MVNTMFYYSLDTFDKELDFSNSHFVIEAYNVFFPTYIPFASLYFLCFFSAPRWTLVVLVQKGLREISLAKQLTSSLRSVLPSFTSSFLTPLLWSDCASFLHSCSLSSTLDQEDTYKRCSDPQVSV